MALSVFEGLELAGQLRSQVEGSGTNVKALAYSTLSAELPRMPPILAILSSLIAKSPI